MGQMKIWEDWYRRVLGLERFMTFDDKDISTEYTALNSIVMANESRSIKFPINEPAPGKRKSQVEEYNEFYQASGVQHIAPADERHRHDHPPTARQRRGVSGSPDSYYEMLTERVGKIDEDIETLREQRILVDRDEEGYLCSSSPNRSKTARRSSSRSSSARRAGLRQGQFQSLIRGHRARTGEARKFSLRHCHRGAADTEMKRQRNREIDGQGDREIFLSASLSSSLCLRLCGFEFYGDTISIGIRQ